MNFISELKTRLDFALFNTSNDSFKLSSEMQKCQRQLNSLFGIYNFNGLDNDGKKKIKDLILKIKSRISELKNKKSQVNDVQKTDLNSRIKELETAVKELEKLEKTVTKYNFEIDKEAPQLNYNNNTDTITVKYDGTLGNLANELKHAFQFETGKLDFIQVDKGSGKSINIPGVLYDVGDELETFKRQYAYDGIIKLRMSWTEEELNTFLIENFNELRRSFNISTLKGDKFGVLEVKSMKYLTADIVVKIKDTESNSSQLYSTLSTNSLDINSKLKDIQENNVNRLDLGNLSWMGLDDFKKKTPYIEFVKVFIKEKPFIHVK